MLVFKPREDGINGRPGHPQHPADADLLPPLIVELDDDQPGLGTVGVGVVVPPLRPGDGTGLPDCLDRFVINRLPKFDEQDARQLAVVKPIVESFEAVDCLPNRVRDARGPAQASSCCPTREEAEHPARLKLAHEPTDGIRMRVCLISALLRGRVPQEHDGADDFIAPLDGVHKAERELGKIGRPRQRFPLEMTRQ